jgi:hypothetical protein
MSTDLVRVGNKTVQLSSGKAILPKSVERAGGPARFAAWRATLIKTPAFLRRACPYVVTSRASFRRGDPAMP